MVEFATRDDAEVLVRKTLCSCFFAVDGTITLRPESVPNAAQAIASCLASHGLFESGMDARSVEKAIRAFVRPGGERFVPVSVEASDVAASICDAMHGLALAA